MRALFIIILLSVGFLAFGQRENTLPIKGTSAPTDTIRLVKDNQSSLQLRSVLQGAIYDSLATHTDTLQALRADIDAGGSVDVMDSIAVHRTELNNLHDSIADHRIDIDANLDSIGIHRTELDNLHDSISDHRTEINANTSTGVTNGGNISANSVFIGVNTADIASLEDSIAKHTDTLQLHQTQISALGFNYWTRNAGGYLYPTTTTDDIRLESVSGQLQFGGTANYINGVAGSNAINFYTNSTQKMLIGPLSIVSTVPFNPSGSTTLGQAGAYWNEVYANRYYIDAATSYIDVSGSDMTFTDVTTGTKTLAELAASTNWTKAGTDLSPTTAGDDILLPTASEIHFGSSSDKMAGDGSEIKVSINGSEMFTFGDGTNYTHDDFWPSSDNGMSLGAPGAAFDDMWSYEYSFKEQATPAAPSANTGDLWMSSTDEKLYFQNSATTYDLTTGSDSSWTSITVDTIDGLNTDAQIIFIEQENPFIQFWSDGNKTVEFQGTAAHFGVAAAFTNRITVDTIRFNDANTEIWEDGSSELSFKDAVTGTKTLAELASSSGSDDIMYIARAQVLYSNTSQTTIITLPDGAVVWDYGLWVYEIFNGSGTDVLNIGITGSTSRYEAGYGMDALTFDDYKSPTNLPDGITSSTNVTFQYVDQNSDASAGAAYVYIHYSLH